MTPYEKFLCAVLAILFALGVYTAGYYMASVESCKIVQEANK